MTQIKFTIETDIVAAFKARCVSDGISMAEAARQWMRAGQPAKRARPRIDTRPLRRKAVLDAASLLDAVLQAEMDYLDAIPESFESRRDSAERACCELEAAIDCLRDAF